MEYQAVAPIGELHSEKVHTLTAHRFPLVACCAAAVVFLLGAFSITRAAEPVTFQSLLKEMPDRSVLARFPDPPYVSVQESSHDRSKTDPNNADTWHSNQDMGQFNRTEENQGRKEWVIMEHEGPGAIVRIWLPLAPEHDKTNIRFYFDGSKDPGITANFNELLSGKGFAKPPFAFISWNQRGILDQEKHPPESTRGVGGDFYLPIPFAKGCKITLDALPFYYHVGYREYPASTEVKTFSMADFNAGTQLMEEVGALLTQCPAFDGDHSDGVQTVEPGQILAPNLIEGPVALSYLAVKIDPKDGEQALRSTVLEAEFDDQQTIWCPIGDFFGCGPRLQPVFDSVRNVTPDGQMVERWVMPYQHHARLVLHNFGKTPIHVSVNTELTNWKWDDRSMYFHANWHSEHEIKTRPRIDWNYLKVTGKGVYVGDTLSVYSPTPGWYGEGDERIYVDGEKFPSHLGTGTEDYYGYAWGMANFFSSPFLSAPLRDTGGRDNWKGYTITSRVRALDAIPFTKSLKHDMEIWHWDDTKVDYAAATFWYGAPGAMSNAKADVAEATMPIRPPQPDPMAKLPGAIELDAVKVTQTSPGLKVGAQEGDMLAQGHWSGGKQVFVQATKSGDFITFSIPAPGNTPQKLTLYVTRSYDYGTLRITINGQKVEKEYDAYSATPVASGPIELGTFEPKDGAYEVKVEVAGTNAAARGPKYYMGLDCVVLSKP